MANIKRPTPHEFNARGLPAYDPLEVGAYRKAHGVTAEELAKHLGIVRTYVSRLEMARYGPLEARQGDRMLAGVEVLARNRMVLVEEGARDLAAIRGTKR